MRVPQSGCPVTGKPHLRNSAVLAALLGPLAMGGGAHAQTERMAVDEAAAVDAEAGMRVPQGFVAEVFADDLGRARHIAVRDNGDVFVALRRPNEGGGLVALRDEDGDGSADQAEYFGDHAGTGVAIHDGFLYASSDDAIYRYALPEDALAPSGAPETVVADFPVQRSHASKAFAIDDAGNLYVNVGAPSNACQQEDRTLGSPGQDPCPLLEQHAGLWRFDADKAGQTFADGERFVTGTRNIVALDWSPEAGALYFVMHGRDQLHDLYPDLYTVEQNAELPAEEFHVAREGADYGWPYTYWNPESGAARRRPRIWRRRADPRRRRLRAAAAGLPRPLGAERPAVLHGRRVPGGGPGRRVHRVPRLLEPRAAAAARLQCRVRAVRGRRAFVGLVGVRRRLHGRRGARGQR